jgi:hypothetical protein
MAMLPRGSSDRYQGFAGWSGSPDQTQMTGTLSMDELHRQLTWLDPARDTTLAQSIARDLYAMASARSSTSRHRTFGSVPACGVVTLEPSIVRSPTRPG